MKAPAQVKKEESADERKMMFCTSCGKQMEAEAKFCKYCGAKVNM